MQEMLTICQEYCSEFCLTFNVKKSKVLYFGKANTHVSDLMLDGKPLEFVKQWKYLGVTVTAGSSLCFSARPALASFYRAVNSILSVLRKPDELVLMNLLYSNCVPILTYGAEVVEFSNTDMRDCNTAINDAIRKIYSYNRWESTRFLRENLGFPSIYNFYEIFRSEIWEVYHRISPQLERYSSTHNGCLLVGANWRRRRSTSSS